MVSLSYKLRNSNNSKRTLEMPNKYWLHELTVYFKSHKYSLSTHYMQIRDYFTWVN